LKVVESYDGSNSHSTPNDACEGVGLGEITSSNGTPIHFDTTALVTGADSSPNVKFVDDSANASTTDF